MASLRKTVKNYQKKLCDGITWVLFWRDGSSWCGEFLSLEIGSNLISFDDIGYLKQICAIDPGAIVLNERCCCNLNKGYSFAGLVTQVRWCYKNGMYTLLDFIKKRNSEIPTEQLEKARQLAHAAGLPYSERPYSEQTLDTYVYDGTITPEDYELLQQIIERNRGDYDGTQR